MLGQQHLIQCHCILPQFRGMKNPVFHKFTVFSVIDDGDTVIPKHAQCNNCGIIHNVYDICKSEIVMGREESRSIVTIDDIKLSLSHDLTNLLINYGCEVPVWENINFIIQQNLWDSQVVLTRELSDNIVTGKVMTIKSDTKFVVDHYRITT